MSSLDAPLSKEERRSFNQRFAEQEMEKCNHISFHNPPSMVVMETGNELCMIVSHNCSHCGHIFTKLIPLAEKPEPVLTVPENNILR